MAVAVKTQDGVELRIGGQFQQALAWVKGLPGRRWDAVRKQWSVGLSAEELLAKAKFARLPVELPDGGHQTGWGNRYSAEQWARERALHEAERRVSQEETRQLQALREALRQRLAAAGLRPEAVDVASRLIVYGELDEAVADGRIRFSSPEREREIRAIAAWYWAEADRIGDAAEAAREAAREELGME